MRHIVKKFSEHKNQLSLLKQKLNKEIHENINKTIKVQAQLQKQQLDLKEENITFLNSYFIATSYIKEADPFFNLKNQYCKRGYKIPNLSLSNNIFRPNPLLAANDREIQMYYNVNTTNKEYDHKPKRYLIRMQKELNWRIANIGKEHNKTTSAISSYNDTSYEAYNIDNNLQKILNENSIMERYNNNIEHLIKEEFHHIPQLHKQNFSREITVSLSKFNTQKTEKNKCKCVKKVSVRHKILSKEKGKITPTEENANNNYIDTSRTSNTDITSSLLNSQERNNNHKKKSIIKDHFLFIKTKNEENIKYSKTHKNEKEMNIVSRENSLSLKRRSLSSRRTNKKKQSNVKIKNLQSTFTETVFESKHNFFEYLKKIGIDDLTPESLFAISKEYLRKVKNWKEESIRKYLYCDSALNEINRLVVDFNNKIALYDVVGGIPDKTKNSNAKKLIELDSIARKLPKHVIQRMIRGSKIKSDE